MFTFEQTGPANMSLYGSLKQNDVFIFVQQITRKPWPLTTQIEINLENFKVEDGIAMLALIKVLETYREKTAGLTLRDPSEALLKQLENAGLFKGSNSISIIAHEYSTSCLPTEPENA